VADPREQWEEQRRAERRERRRQLYRRGLRPFSVAAWNISKEHNVGSLIRTAHATAASEVILAGTRDWNVEAARTSELYTHLVHVDTESALLERVRRQGRRLVAVELDERAVSLLDAVYPEHPCFLLGAELGGVPETLLDEAELIVRIPQWGLVPSLNLAVAGSIVIYDYLAKLYHRGALDRPQGGLPEEPQ